MSKVNITSASKLVNISRATMYKKYINPGVISVEFVDNIKLIDTSELLRVFGYILSKDTVDCMNDTPIDTTLDTSKDKIINLLEQQLHEAREEKRWLMQQLEKTTLLLEDRINKKRKKIFGIF